MMKRNNLLRCWVWSSRIPPRSHPGYEADSIATSDKRRMCLSNIPRFVFLLGGIVLVVTGATNVWAGNVVTRWVDQALNTVRAGNISTPAGARLYAMATVSMYDAVNGIDRLRHRSMRAYALVPPDGAPIAGNRRAATAAAAHAVLIALLPSHASVLDGALAEELATLGGQGAPPVALGRDWGHFVGEQVVALWANDGTQVAETPPPGTGPGEFRLPFTGAQFRHMSPFGVESIAPYASPGPPLLTSTEYCIRRLLTR